jgi:hypothetical protein
MKRGDTKLLPPDGVCQYCATDEPGGGHAYQRWSPVCVMLRSGEIWKFVCCRYCYTRTTPSYKGRTEIGSGGELLIFNRNGKPLLRFRHIKMTRFSIGYSRSEKMHFTESSRDRVLRHYWDDVKSNKRRKSGHPHTMPESIVDNPKDFISIEEVLGEEMGIIIQDKKEETWA